VHPDNLYKQLNTDCAVPENIRNPPTEEGGGFYKTKKFNEMNEAYLEFPEGWRGVRKNSFRGGDIDIFWE